MGARRAVSLPVLRKDFIVDRYQVYESRVAGADAILLIAECMNDQQLRELLALATDLKMTALVEVHDADNLQRIRPHLRSAQAHAVLLGINNRDLKTMTVDLGHCLRMLDQVDDPGVVVAESGIRTAEDVARLRQAGLHRVLVGEHLMRQADVGAALRTLMQ